MMMAAMIGGMLSLVLAPGERGMIQAPTARAATTRQPATGD